MRRLAAVALVLALGGCGTAVPESRVVPSPSAEPVRATVLGCGEQRITYTVPAGLKRGDAITRIPGLPGRYEAKGVAFGSADDTLWIGVVCGVNSAQRFVTLVGSARLTTYEGLPALRWNTRGSVRHFMWLERPGLAVYVAATPDLADQIATVAATIASE
ncbi:hypothetical protein ACIBEJ_17655 [Nonomuraea sp. NPDC050790]|uniref:hypothetical protein n=1 Tax=Nonomuraea sp. NPDC050790 TaxID=3364371 RepID=UPI0037B94B17